MTDQPVEAGQGQARADVAAPGPRAFRGDVRRLRAFAAAKAVWWSANRAAGRALLAPERSHAGSNFTPSYAPPPKGLVQKAWAEAFAKDAADVAAGLYPVTESAPGDLKSALKTAIDLFEDTREVEARRRRGGRVEARAHAQSSAYPTYYRQNFHYQSGGWFTAESARRYEAQVETLFSGAAGPMRRRALSLLAKAWRARDHRDLKLVDLACGSGAFLSDLKATFPRARLMGVDLSAAYSAQAQARTGVPVIQAAAERLPFADASLDAVSCIYLFHELPPKVRVVVAREIARVLKPGGVLAFADSLQARDVPDLGRLMEAFPVFFHEPYYASYQAQDLEALFGDAGLSATARDQAFLTKAILLEKAG
jgi:ubiquinone/menaquinone biosynthesis C-methylase UbiE